MSNPPNRNGNFSRQRFLPPPLNQGRYQENYPAQNNAVNHRGYNNEYAQNPPVPRRDAPYQYANVENERRETRVQRAADIAFVPPRREPHDYRNREGRQPFEAAGGGNRLNSYQPPPPQERNLQPSSAYGSGYRRYDDEHIDAQQSRQYQYNNDGYGVHRDETDFISSAHELARERHHEAPVSHDRNLDVRVVAEPSRRVQPPLLNINNPNRDQQRREPSTRNESHNVSQEYPEADDSWITRGSEGFFNGRRPLTDAQYDLHFGRLANVSNPSSSNRKFNT